jgi:hypothetical protein
LKLRFVLPPLPRNIDVKQATIRNALNVDVLGERDGVRGYAVNDFSTEKPGDLRELGFPKTRR